MAAVGRAKPDARLPSRMGCPDPVVRHPTPDSSTEAGHPADNTTTAWTSAPRMSVIDARVFDGGSTVFSHVMVRTRPPWPQPVRIAGAGIGSEVSGELTVGMITHSNAVVYTGRVPATYPTTTQFDRPGVLPSRKESTQHIHLGWRVQREAPCPASRHEIPTLQTTIVRLGSWASVEEPAPHHRRQSGIQPQARHHAARCVCPPCIRRVPAVYPLRARGVPAACPCSRCRGAHVQHSVQTTTQDTGPDLVANDPLANLFVYDNGIGGRPCGPAICITGATANA